MQNKNHNDAVEFQPFDSLRGFREYLHEKEKQPIYKKELMEDECERLNCLFQQLQKGDNCLLYTPSIPDSTRNHYKNRFRIS